MLADCEGFAYIAPCCSCRQDSVAVSALSPLPFAPEPSEPFAVAANICVAALAVLIDPEIACVRSTASCASIQYGLVVIFELGHLALFADPSVEPLLGSIAVVVAVGRESASSVFRLAYSASAYAAAFEHTFEGSSAAAVPCFAGSSSSQAAQAYKSDLVKLA